MHNIELDMLKIITTGFLSVYRVFKAAATARSCPPRGAGPKRMEQPAHINARSSTDAICCNDGLTASTRLHPLPAWHRVRTQCRTSSMSTSTVEQVFACDRRRSRVAAGMPSLACSKNCQHEFCPCVDVLGITVSAIACCNNPRR